MKVAEALYKAAFLTPAGQMPADKQVPVTKEMSGIRRAAGTFHNFTQQHMDYMTGGPVKRMMRPGKPVVKLAFEKYALSYNRIMAAVSKRFGDIDNAMAHNRVDKAGYLANKTKNQAKRMGALLQSRLGTNATDSIMTQALNPRPALESAIVGYVDKSYDAMGRALRAGKPRAAEKILGTMADGRSLPVSVTSQGGKRILSGGRDRLKGRFTNIAPNKMGETLDRTYASQQSVRTGHGADSLFHIS